MPGIVRLVSATLVARDHAARALRVAARARRPAPARASSPYSGRIRAGVGERRPARAGSRRPRQENQHIALGLACARRGAREHHGLLRNRRRAAAAGPAERYCVVTGKARPAELMQGTPPSRLAAASPSSVADITTSFRSPPSLARIERQRQAEVGLEAAPWNLSNSTTAATPSSAGSACNIRVNTPSVIDPRCASPDRRAFRGASGSPRSRSTPRRASAPCIATARVARRRGSSTSRRRPRAQGSSASTSGTTVFCRRPAAPAARRHRARAGHRGARAAPRRSAIRK